MCQAKKKDSERRGPSTSDPAYEMELSLRTIVVSVGIATIVSFLCGCACRTFVLQGRLAVLRPLIATKASCCVEGEGPCKFVNSSSSSPAGDFNTKVESSGWIIHDDDEDMNESETASGQHILMNIEKIGSSFLKSPDRLLEAILHLVDESDSTLRSYRCQEAYYCVGILDEGHIHIRTWPAHSVLIMDLFLKDEDSATYLLPAMMELFGVEESAKNQGGPQMQWSIKRRGARPGVHFNPEDIDLSERLLGDMLMKKNQVASVESPFQRIDIYDVVDIKTKSTRKSLVQDGYYEAHHSENYPADRVVYLDSIMQSRRHGEAAYHEALVHPMLFLHDNPKRVAIIGGGEGATLREILKHKTVEKVVMIDIDEVMVNTSRKYLPEWSDCSNLVGSAESCFDDPRAEVYYEDAIAWFIGRYFDKEKIDQNDLFDVIILDALDPSSVVEFSDMLYGNDDLMNALSNAVGVHGIVGAQIGETDDLDGLPDYLDPSGLDSFVNCLKRAGFASIVDYSEDHGRFLAPWDYLVALKDETSKHKWFRNEAEVAAAIQRRAMQTKTGESPFRYFDGSTMMSYQYPSQIDEVVSCRNETTPESCKTGSGFNPEILNIPASALQVRPSSVDDGRGVYTTIPIPENAYIGLEDTVHGLVIPPSTYKLIQNGEQYLMQHNWNTFTEFLEAYCWMNSIQGATMAGVDTSITMFINHGCNGTYSIGPTLPVTELQVNWRLGQGGLDVDTESVESWADPVTMRQFPNRVIPQALHNILAGEELLGNHLAHHDGKTIEQWQQKVGELQAMCSSGTS